MTRPDCLFFHSFGAKSVPLFLAAVLLAPNLGHTQELASQVQDSIEHRVQQFMDEKGVPGLSIAIARDNAICYSRAFGMANVEHQVLATTSTRYRTASIAKSMTAVVVLSLAEQGKLDLDEPVQTYCPEFPMKRWPVTSRQLLGHLGGIRHYKSRAETLITEHYSSLSAALAIFKDDPLHHEPGTEYLYSTFGYNLLGSVAEGASDMPFAKLIEETVFLPAGMKDTAIDSQHEIIPHRTAGYFRPSVVESLRMSGRILRPGELYNAPLHDTSMKIPAGGLLSTAPDLVRFGIAVNKHQLLSQSTTEAMWTPQEIVNPETGEGKLSKYGLGWTLGAVGGKKTVGHTGGQAGTATVLHMVPESGTVVAIMCNLQSAGPRKLAEEIAASLQSGTTDENDYSRAIQKLDGAIRYEMRQKDIPAFSIALVDSQGIQWSQGFGFVDEAQEKTADAKTLYRVGSVSKLFTDIAIMKLVSAGTVDLDVPVNRYLPDFKLQSGAGNVTLRQLMSHQSGLVRESPIGNYFDPSEPSLGDTVASLNQTSLVYSPNTKTKYSNAAVSVVGAVLEQVAGGTHADYVKQHLFRPLEMTSSSFELNDAVRRQRATGWMRTYDGQRFVAPDFQLGTGPAGNLYSSVEDLGRFLQCLLLNGKRDDQVVIPGEILQQMTAPVKDQAGREQPFGLGFHIQELDGIPKIGHGGAIYGFSTEAEALPSRGVAVAAVASLDGSNGVVRRLTDYALRLMLCVQDGGELPDYERTIAVPAERAQALVGSYQERNGQRTAHIERYGDELLCWNGSYLHRCRARASDSEIVFDDEFTFGTPVKLTMPDELTIGSRVYDRQNVEPPAPAPDRWKALIGEYGWDHNVLYILERDQQLYALIEWFYYYPLKEVSKDVFAFPDYGLYHGEKIEFHRKDNGEVDQCVAAEVVFQRREVGLKDGETFKIDPVQPIEELRAAALSASPPVESGDFRKAELVDLTVLDDSIALDIRYATTNNFMGSVFYKQPKAFLQRPAAKALVRVHRALKQKGLGLLIHDAYRPWPVTKMFWDATPQSMKDFVANPANGSRHNRGCAVDLTLYDLETGNVIPMVAGYDEFSTRSYPLYPGGTSRQRWYRSLLRTAMESEGFTIYEYEWWHFDYQDWRKYRIGARTFERVIEDANP